MFFRASVYNYFLNKKKEKVERALDRNKNNQNNVKKFEIIFIRQ